MIYFGMFLNFLAMALGRIFGVAFIGVFAYGLYVTAFESFTGGLAAFFCNILLALSAVIGEKAIRR